MAENQNKCTGNCMACTIFQRQYCASQLSYSNMRMLEQMQKDISEMWKKIEAIQNSEANVFCPTEEKSEIPTLLTGTSGSPTDHTTQ